MKKSLYPLLPSSFYWAGINEENINTFTAINTLLEERDEDIPDFTPVLTSKKHIICQQLHGS